MCLLSLSSYPHTFLPEDGNRFICRTHSSFYVFLKPSRYGKSLKLINQDKKLLFHCGKQQLITFQMKRPLGSNLSQCNPVSTLTPNLCDTNFDVFFVQVNGKTQLECC
jgi:hypothetical protein